MLRMALVFVLIGVGVVVSVQGPFPALLFYLWNAYFRPESWTYGGFVQSLKLSYLIGVYLVVRTALTLPDPQLNLRTGLIFLFAIQAVVGTVTTESPDWSHPFISDFGKVLLISYLLVVLLNDRKKFRIALLVIALSLGLECAKQGWANLFRAPGARNDNPIPFLGDNNGVALGTMMLMPLFGALAQTATRHWEKQAHRFIGVGVFLRGISTYSRGGFLAAGVLGLFSLLRSEKKARTLLIVGAGALLVWSLMPARYWARMDTITVEEEEQRDSSAAGRLHFWSVAMDMARAKPFTGVGLNGFIPAYPSYNTDVRFGGQRATHSTWFGVLADLGYPGLILFVGNLLLAVYSCWRVSKWSRGDPALRDLGIYANALITSMAVFAVAGTFLSSQYNEMLWHFVGLSAALHGIALRERAAATVPARVPQIGFQPVTPART